MKKVVVSALMFFCVVALWAQNVPATLSYQGILLQNDGITPLADGPQTIVFNFYDVPTGGAAQFSRTITVTTLKGLYTCILGDGTMGNAPLPATLGNQQMYIGITVNGGAELTPRAQLTTTPYAWMAQSAYSIADNAVNSAKIADGTITDADLSAGAAITDTKLATITTAGKVANSATSATAAGTANTIVARDASGNFTAGTITANVVGNVTGNISGNAATVTTNANLMGDVTSVGNATSIAAGAIVNADINNAAAIADTKLATIATAGKVANSATTATNANTANTIVARDASGNFAAGTITANLVGNVTGNLTGNATTVTTNANLTGDVTSVGNATTIASNAVTSGKILAGAVTDAKLASGIDAGKITTGILAGSLVGTGINGANLTDGSVTNGKVASGIDAGKITTGNLNLGTGTIASGAITSSGTITGDGSLLTNLDASKLATGTINAARLPASTLTGTGTSGNIPFWTGATTFGNDASLFWDNTNDRLGLGTNIPSTRFHVVGNGNSLRLQGTDHTFIEFYPDGPATRRGYLGFSSGPDNNIYLHNEISGAHIGLMTTGTGNVGIGTTSPSQNLTVQNGMNIDAAQANNGTVANSLRFGSGTSGEAIASKRTAGGNASGLDFYTGSISRMSIALGGNVGIGTTNPTTSRLTLLANGGVQMGGTALSNLFSASGTQLPSTVGSEVNLASFGSSVLGNDVSLGIRIRRFTTGSDWNSVSLGLGMDVDNSPRAGSSGELWLGPSGAGFGVQNPQATLHVVGTGQYNLSGSNPLRIYQGDDGDGVRMYSPDLDYWTLGTYNSNNFWFSYNGNTKAYIDDVDGSWEPSSDARLKENIFAMGPVLKKILSLKPKVYNFRSDQTKTKCVGFIAQEVMEIFPEAVQLQADGFFTLSYQDIGVYLVKAVKEQQEIIDQNSIQIDELKSRNKDLEARLLSLERSFGKSVTAGSISKTDKP